MDEKTKKMYRKRCVWWFAMSYALPAEFANALNKADKYAYIYHDKDVDTEPHYHVLLHFENARSGFAVLKDFVSTQNTMLEAVTSPISSYEYLYHLNDPDKFQYDKSEIICHNPVFWEHFLPSIRDRNEVDFLDDLLNVYDFDLKDMAKKYGRDFIKNFRSYLDFRESVLPMSTQKKY